ncbi:uncharacterized protein LOC118754033 isoform X1 [Rhagoletis pomonella]|uniref:uncharacterized protein LOC118754033 isoform X1 n=1 Tax=Rhagoletis pomonella TaxID=28610 RepID=UPI0017838878|nr:uncharacterized protein LOC118754033 isoform X1 [Rhagoletis pomonella]
MYLIFLASSGVVKTCAKILEPLIWIQTAIIQKFAVHAQLSCVNMSLKSIAYACGATDSANLSNQSNVFKVKYPFTKPVTQNILANLISGLSMPFCKDVNKKPNNATSILLASDEGIVSDEHPINLSCPYRRQRQRTISENSDDICFLEDESNNHKCDFSPTYYAEDDDYDLDDTDSEDEGCTSTRNPHAEKQDINHSLEANVAIGNGIKIDGNIKKVRFNLNPEVHTMYAWSFAYKSARKGHWESLARDRDRFRKRIENTSKYLNPILRPEHRSFIYNTRFSNDV